MSDEFFRGISVVLIVNVLVYWIAVLIFGIAAPVAMVAAIVAGTWSGERWLKRGSSGDDE